MPGEPLYRQVAARLRDRVAIGELSLGQRLPPIREMARSLALSHITVSRAYRVLQDEGIMRATPGQGTIVVSDTGTGGTLRAHARDQESADDAGERDQAPIWPSFVRSPRGSLLHAAAAPATGGGFAGALIHLGTGQPDAALLPLASLRRAWMAALRDASPTDLLYAGPQGERAVRAALAEYCASVGYAVAPEEVLVTTGTQQAIDLVIRTFIQPGEHVLVESPGYPSALDLLESHGCRLVPVPVDADGLRVDLLPGVIARFQPRLLYLAPTGHNPTGSVLSAQRREALRTLLRDAHLLVLEDDVCSEFLYEGQPQQGVRTVQTRAHVITLKSFAKTVLPGLRVGCLLAAPPLLGPLAATKALTDRFTSPLAQHALRRYLQGRSVRADLARAREAYQERRDVLVAELTRVLPSEIRWTLPQAGLNLWLTLPAGHEMGEVWRLAAARGVLCAPGAAFSPFPDSAAPALRLTFADSSPSQLVAGARRLADTLGVLSAQPDQPGRRDPGSLPVSV